MEGRSFRNVRPTLDDEEEVEIKGKKRILVRQENYACNNDILEEAKHEVKMLGIVNEG